MLKIITATHRLFQRVKSICYLDLTICCKTSEGGADLEVPLTFHLFHFE